MSIQSEIARIDSNIANSLLKVAAKGVTVPDNASSNDLPGLIEQIPTGAQLPELSNPASEAEVLEGYEYIDQEGAAKTGTFTIDSELTEQDSLLTELEAALEGKAAGGGETTTYDTCTVQINVEQGYLYGYAAKCFDGQSVNNNTILQATNLGATQIKNVVCNSVLCVFSKVNMGDITVSNATNLAFANAAGIVVLTPETAGTAVSIQIGSSSGGGSD